MTAGIVDIETATPGKQIDNSYFDGIGLTDEWIRRRTGVAARWWMDNDEPLDRVAAAACAPLVDRHGDGTRIAALIVASCSTGGAVPGIAQRVATRSGLPADVLALDVNAACSGFVYGVISGLALCRPGQAVIVCAVEAMSRLIDKSDRGTGPLFGDGVGAVLLAQRSSFRDSAWHAGSDGERVGLMTGEIGGGIHLDGMQVYDRAVKMMTDTLDRLHSQGPAPDVIVGHQANSRILQKIRDQVDAGDAVFVDSVSQFGNTSAASIPLALGTCVAERSIPESGRTTLVAYGAGEAWGGVSLDYDLAAAMARGSS
jgi:3-oxoacyl-[acyl-carrier-protein] synthase III